MSLWRRSLLGRVVAATMILSLAVGVVLGALLVQRIRSELLAAKLEVAFSEASQMTQAQEQFRLIDPDSQDSRDQVVLSVLERMTSGGGQTGGQYVLLVYSGTDDTHANTPPQRPIFEDLTDDPASEPSVEPSNEPVTGLPSDPSADQPDMLASQPDYPSGVLTREDLPTALRHQVHSDEGTWWTYLTMPVSGTTPGTVTKVPGLAIGQQVYLPGAGAYEFYLLFPLTQEQRTLEAVRQAVALTGLLLVVAVGVVAWLVARQVVRPVQMAAGTAERLAAGQLHERMPVHGEDEITRLGVSFNKMAASLQHQIHQLEELSRLQRRFVSDVSHELRTPLTTVRMAADVIHAHSETFDEGMGRSSQLMQNQLDHFESLLADLLEISRFDAAAAVLDLETVDVGQLAERVIAVLEPLAGQHGSQIFLHVGLAGLEAAGKAAGHPRVDDADELACTAALDSRRIERVVRNLVANAIEHGLGKPIVVQVAVNEHAVALSVRDFGMGLSSEEALHVFDRFWRADPSRARTIGGTGLGLAISLEDVRLHGGWLQANGQPGQGALFRMTVPRERDLDLDELHAQRGFTSPLPLELSQEDRKRLTAGSNSSAGSNSGEAPSEGVPSALTATDVSSSSDEADDTKRRQETES